VCYTLILLTLIFLPLSLHYVLKNLQKHSIGNYMSKSQKVSYVVVIFWGVINFCFSGGIYSMAQDTWYHWPIMQDILAESLYPCMSALYFFWILFIGYTILGFLYRRSIVIKYDAPTVNSKASGPNSESLLNISKYEEKVLKHDVKRNSFDFNVEKDSDSVSHINV